MGKSKDKASSGEKSHAKEKQEKPAKVTVERRLLAELPALSNAERRAFEAQFSAAKCDAMGGRTKSEGVLREVREHAAVIAKALRKHPGELRRYGRARFAWLLTCIAALDDARDAQLAADGSPRAARDRIVRVTAAAKVAREDLLDALTTIAEGHEADEQALAAAAGSVTGTFALLRSLRGLALLGREWLGRDSEEAKALAASVSLSLADLDVAEEAADALEVASGDRTMEGRITFRDTPSVNRAEGRVLLELRLAMRAFARAHERNKEIPALYPGGATRGVLRRKSPDGDAVDEAPAEAEPTEPAEKPAGD
jgi:hypothetical protein